MALNQISIIDVIEVIENGILQVRQRNDIVDDVANQVVASSFHRSTFAPGDDVSAMPDRVKSIASAVWTPEVISAYQAQLESNHV